MSSHGKAETDRLKKNLEEQLDRLVQQLEDLEVCRITLDETDYQECKEDTMEQLREFNESLQRMISGNMTLVDELGAMQLATQAAISAAFQTPAVIRMFGKREPARLKERLSQLDRDVKLGKLDKQTADCQRGEILSALRQLGEKLESSELQLLERLSLNNIDSTRYVQVNEITERGQMALDVVGKEVKASQDT
ncbi:protein LZIC [Monomorium pharaonis]|uniref:protein LZIC n=1 Tax=Monomorium pharaonis TaxID=307658 RepID=UPI00063F57D2|nr:protein LZIC [Monomorium pharaonis]XP_012536187.1 protein LZIC [Monomorium pharaonis]XP_036149424.1 protein LZIC [Monomorium pharaonis]XP_036149425.1 protein LZIC [Monomorium pharaonis]